MSFFEVFCPVFVCMEALEQQKPYLHIQSCLSRDIVLSLNRDEAIMQA